MLARVGYGRRAEDELGLAAEAPAQPAEAPDYVGYMRPEDPAVDVGLVDDHVAQSAKKLVPGSMVW